MYTKTILSILGGVAISVAPLCAQTGAVSKRDAEFLKMAAEADMTSTHIGKMAEDSATADGVKDFGKKLAQDHTSDYNKLCEFAAKTGESVPRAIDKQGDREKLCLSSSANSGGADWTFDAGMGFRARAAWERLALVSPVETITLHLPVFVMLPFSALAVVPC